MDVVSVLEVPVTVVQVVDVVVMLDGLAAVTFGVGALVVSVNGRFLVVLVTVNMVYVVVMLDGLAAVLGQVLVIGHIDMAHGVLLISIGCDRVSPEAYSMNEIR